MIPGRIPPIAAVGVQGPALGFVLEVRQQVLQQIMLANLKDEAQSWTLDADGRYSRDPSWDHPNAFSAHEYFMTNPSLSGRGQKVKDMPRAIDHVASRG